MKNIYLVPTKTPCTLFKYNTGNFRRCYPSQYLENGENYHLYITETEEIREHDIDNYACIFISDNGIITTLAGKGFGRVKTIGKYFKIILTTDKDLIESGVQAIQDEFLEWFVKKPNCEFVDIEEKDLDDVEKELEIFGHDISITENELEEYKKSNLFYKIIIPKEEPKQETLEEAAIYYENNDFVSTTPSVENAQQMIQRAFIAGAKWQEQRMYSEEDMINFVNWLGDNRCLDDTYKANIGWVFFLKNDKGKDFKSTKELLEKWFEQFKKKK